MTVTYTTEGVLNELTRTVHKPDAGMVDPHTACGVAYHLGPGQPEGVSVERATDGRDASKCGRCFGGGS